jgi:hypothetical protein
MDPDGSIAESILSEPGEIILRLFVGAIDETNSVKPRMLVATQWVDTFDYDRTPEGRSVKLTCRGPVGKMIEQHLIAHTRDFYSQVHGFSYWSHTTRGMDNLSQVAGISGTWEMDGSNGLKLTTATTTGCYVDQMHSTWLTDFVDGLIIFHFKLDSSYSGGPQAAMATIRSYGRYCHWKISYLFDSLDANDPYHDDIFIQKIEGSFSGEAKLDENVPGFDDSTDCYIRAKIYRQTVTAWFSTNGLDWTPCDQGAVTMTGEATELTGPEDAPTYKKPMIGSVGLGGYAASTGRVIHFDFLKVCSSHPPYTLEEAIKELCTFAGVPKVTFDSHLMELPNSDGVYNLDNFTTGAGSVTFDENKMKIEHTSAAWAYATCDIETPDSFRLDFVMSAYRGEVRFKGGDTHDQDFFVFGWREDTNVAYIGHKDASTYDDYDHLSSFTPPADARVTICCRAVHFATEESSGAEADYWTVSVFLDDNLWFFQEFPIDWAGGNKLRFYAYDTTGDAYYSNIRIAELTDFIDYFGIDYGQPVLSSLRNVMADKSVEVIPRFDGSIHFRRASPKDVALEFEPGHVVDFGSHFSNRDLATHYRIEGAYDEVDYIYKTMVNLGFLQRFRLLKNENLMTVDDIHQRGPAMINLAYEQMHAASITARGDPSLEVGDLVVFDRLRPWIVAIEQGTLSYPDDTHFQDLGIERDGSDVPWFRYSATSEPLWNICVITNSDGTVCWCYIGGGTATTYYFAAYKDAAMDTAGFNGDTDQPNADGKTPSSYKIFRAGLWTIEQLNHSIDSGSYYQSLGCRGYDSRRE